MKTTWLVFLVLLAISVAPSRAQVPQLINFQGRVVVDGTNFHGTGSFKFALVNEAGNIAYWNNDGSSVGAGEPTSGFALPVHRGLFSVALGDSGLGMPSIPLDTFSNPDVHVRTWFDPGTGYQLLSPDQRIAAVGYAFVAGSLAGDLYVETAGDTMTGPLQLPDNGLTVGTTQLVASAGNVGIGLSSPEQKLVVDGGLRIGNTSLPQTQAGTIRWTGSDFEGFTGTEWVSLTLDSLLHANGRIKGYQVVTDVVPPLTVTNLFGYAVAGLGDLNGDGVADLAAGAIGDDDGGWDRGAVWIVFLGSDGRPIDSQKISDTEGGFTGTLDDGVYFGASAASLGNFDGDSVGDLAVGAAYDNDGGNARGAVWLLFLNTNGTVKAYQKISDTQGGFTGVLSNGDEFGISVTSLGDLDGDGVTDLAVGAPGDDDGVGGPVDNSGAVWILFLYANGTVKSHQKISATLGGFPGGALDENDNFGVSVGALGDLGGDGIPDLAVGAWGDDDGDPGAGAVWVLHLNTNGTVKSSQKISATQGGFDGTLRSGDDFGRSAASLGDLDGDGVTDLGVGAPGDDDGITSAGALWVLFLNTNGTVKAHQKISATQGGFTAAWGDVYDFGTSVTALGDLDGDGLTELAVGSPWSSVERSAAGAVWVLFMDRGYLPGGP